MHLALERLAPRGRGVVLFAHRLALDLAEHTTWYGGHARVCHRTSRVTTTHRSTQTRATEEEIYSPLGPQSVCSSNPGLCLYDRPRTNSIGARRLARRREFKPSPASRARSSPRSTSTYSAPPFCARARCAASPRPRPPPAPRPPRRRRAPRPRRQSRGRRRRAPRPRPRGHEGVTAGGWDDRTRVVLQEWRIGSHQLAAPKSPDRVILLFFLFLSFLLFLLLPVDPFVRFVPFHKSASRTVQPALASTASSGALLLLRSSSGASRIASGGCLGLGGAVALGGGSRAFADFVSAVGANAPGDPADAISTCRARGAGCDERANASPSSDSSAHVARHRARTQAGAVVLSFVSARAARCRDAGASRRGARHARRRSLGAIGARSAANTRQGIGATRLCASFALRRWFGRYADIIYR